MKFAQSPESDSDDSWGQHFKSSQQYTDYPIIDISVMVDGPANFKRLICSESPAGRKADPNIEPRF